MSLSSTYSLSQDMSFYQKEKKQKHKTGGDKMIGGGTTLGKFFISPVPERTIL